MGTAYIFIIFRVQYISPFPAISLNVMNGKNILLNIQVQVSVLFEYFKEYLLRFLDIFPLKIAPGEL